MGAANKNIGDAFLLVWRLPTLTIFENDDISIKRSITDICDLSVISFIKIIGRINRNQGLLKYRKDSRIALRLKNYRVKLK